MDRIGTFLDRPKAYYNIDGVGELGIAFLLLGYSVIGWQQVHAPEHSFWNAPYTVMIYYGGMAAIIHFGSKAIKKHITYPRTGRVEYRRRDTVWRPMIYSLVFSAVAAAALFLFVRSHWSLTTPASLLGLVFAGSYAHGFAGTVRWKWAVVWLLAFFSLAIAVLPADLVGAMAEHSWIAASVPAKIVGATWLTMTFYGTMLLISGAVSFWLYLRNAPLPEAQ